MGVFPICLPISRTPCRDAETVEDPEAVGGRGCRFDSVRACGGGVCLGLPAQRTEVVECRVRGGDGGMLEARFAAPGGNTSVSRWFCCCNKAVMLEGSGVSEP